MDLQVKKLDSLESEYRVNLPHTFLDKLLESDVETTQKAIKITTFFDDTMIVGIREFTCEPGKIEISSQIAEYLNICDDDFIHVNYVNAQDIHVPYLIDIQAERESFGTLTDVKDKFESIISKKSPFINKGIYFHVDNELIHLINIYDIDGCEILYASTEMCDLKVNFLETREEITKKEAEEAEKIRIFNDTHCVGGRELSKDEKYRRLLERLGKL